MGRSTPNRLYVLDRIKAKSNGVGRGRANQFVGDAAERNRMMLRMTMRHGDLAHNTPDQAVVAAATKNVTDSA